MDYEKFISNKKGFLYGSPRPVMQGKKAVETALANWPKTREDFV